MEVLRNNCRCGINIEWSCIHILIKDLELRISMATNFSFHPLFGKRGIHMNKKAL